MVTSENALGQGQFDCSPQFYALHAGYSGSGQGVTACAAFAGGQNPGGFIALTHPGATSFREFVFEIWFRPVTPQGGPQRLISNIGAAGVPPEQTWAISLQDGQLVFEGLGRRIVGTNLTDHPVPPDQWRRVVVTGEYGDAQHPIPFAPLGTIRVQFLSNRPSEVLTYGERSLQWQTTGTLTDAGCVLGADPSGTSRFSGLIKEVRLYNGIPNDARDHVRFASTPPFGADPNAATVPLQFGYQFGEGAGSVSLDLSPNHGVATLGPGTAWTRLWSDDDVNGELDVCQSPCILRQPDPTREVRCAGGSMGRSVTAGCLPPGLLGLQWRRNGVPIPGETRSFLGLFNLREADSGIYDCVVSNTWPSSSSGSPPAPVVSTPFELVVVGTPPTPLASIDPPATCAGSGVLTLSASGSNTDPARGGGQYVWHADAPSGPVIGSGPTITLAAPGRSMDYFVMLEATCGNSAPARVSYTALRTASPIDVFDPVFDEANRYPGGDFADVAAAFTWSAGLRTDGTIAVWGDLGDGRGTPPPPSAGNPYTAIFAGALTGYALRADGSAVAWGLGAADFLSVPAMPPGLGYRKIVGDRFWALGLRSDGSIVQWGSAPAGIPAGTFIDIAAGQDVAMALGVDGRPVAWGDMSFASDNAPAGRFTRIAVTEMYGAGIRDDGSLAQWGFLNLEGYTWPTNPEIGRCVALSASYGKLAVLAEDGRLMISSANGDARVTTQRYRGQPAAGAGVLAVAISSLTELPRSQTVRVGDPVRFEVALAPESEVITPFWYKDGRPAGRFNFGTVYAISAATLADAGEYTCRVVATCGNTETPRARLTVLCAADFNADGIINADDLGDFVSCYFAEPACAAADFNRDANVNPDDLGDFITVYFGGGC